MSWELQFSRQSVKDVKKLKAARLWKNAEKILVVLRENPFQNPPPYERLVADLEGAYSRRINIQHRVVYQVNKAKKQVRVLRMWTHYE